MQITLRKERETTGTWDTTKVEKNSKIGLGKGDSLVVVAKCRGGLIVCYKSSRFPVKDGIKGEVRKFLQLPPESSHHFELVEYFDWDTTPLPIFVVP